MTQLEREQMEVEKLEKKQREVEKQEERCKVRVFAINWAT